jgi:putative ABC transport system permease protein
LVEQYPNQGAGAKLESLHRRLVGEVKQPLFVLLGAVALVLLVACVNVASLLLARGDLRRRELAVRASLGAARTRLIRQLLTEACLMSFAAGVLGVLFAVWATDALIALLPDALPRATEVGMSPAVLVFALGISLLTGLLFGIAPALRTSRGSLLRDMLEGGRASTGSVRGVQSRRALVVAEIALALIPLVGAGLLLRSFQKLTSVDPGFSPRQVLTASYALPNREYNSPQRITGYVDALISRVAAIPGVESVGVTSSALMADDNTSGSFEVVGRPVVSSEETPWTQMRAASPAYFDAVGIQLVRGRGFQATDRAGAPMVALVDAAFVSKFFPDGQAIGKQIRMGFDKTHPREIVGVVSSIHHNTLSAPREPHIYFPTAQQPLEFGAIFVRTKSAPASLISPLASAARAVDRNVPLYGVRSLEAAVASSVARPRFNAILLSLFGACALLIAALGIYAVLSYGVAERKREIGIRVALGARPGDVLRLIVGEGARLTGLGVVLGAAASLLLGRVLSTMLFGVSAHDAGTLLVVSGLLIVVALFACYLPARRAARLDPAATLSD